MLPSIIKKLEAKVQSQEEQIQTLISRLEVLEAALRNRPAFLSGPEAVLPSQSSPPQSQPLSSQSPQCMHRKGLVHNFRVEGQPEKNLWNWSTHLQNTLFLNDMRKSNAFYTAMVPLWDHMEVMSCRSVGNRYYCVRCKHCHEYVAGEFSKYTSEDGQMKAQIDLLEFVGVDTSRFAQNLKPPQV